MIDTEEKARKKVGEVWASKELFIILSESQYHDGCSVPRAFQVSESNVSLSVFTTYKAAERFCREEGYVADGVPLIGRIDNTDKLRDLFSIVNTALYLGVTHTDIDCLTDDAMNIKLIALMDWNGRKPENISMLLSKEEYERMKAGGKLGVRFNEMRLYKPM